MELSSCVMHAWVALLPFSFQVILTIGDADIGPPNSAGGKPMIVPF